MFSVKRTSLLASKAKPSDQMISVLVVGYKALVTPVSEEQRYSFQIRKHRNCGVPLSKGGQRMALSL
jgi:hypothetical protein